MSWQSAIAIEKIPTIKEANHDFYNKNRTGVTVPGPFGILNTSSRFFLNEGY